MQDDEEKKSKAIEGGTGFCVITLNYDDFVTIGDDIKIVIKDGKGGNRAKVAIKAPRELIIRRWIKK